MGRISDLADLAFLNYDFENCPSPQRETEKMQNSTGQD